MSRRLVAGGLAFCGVFSGCAPGALQVRNQTGEAIWITMHLSDGMVEEAGLIDNGEAIVMGRRFEGVDRIEYGSGGGACHMDREDIQGAPETRWNGRRTVVLKPCEPMVEMSCWSNRLVTLPCRLSSRSIETFFSL